MKRILQSILLTVLLVAGADITFAGPNAFFTEPVSPGAAMAGDMQSQSLVISGRVTAAESGTGEPESLPGVSISIKGTSAGTVTDEDGKYTIEVPSAESILVFSFIGYSPEEVTVGNKSVIDVTMTPDIIALGEILVVGYGEQRKLTSTGAFSSVKGEDLARAPVAGVSNALIGMTPGVQAIQTSGEFGNDKADIRIRGIATLNTSGADPLILVDGVQRENFNGIDLNEIESINILKDASATAVFGVRGANGVILITTKQGKPGKPKVSFTSNVAMLQPSILPKLLNAHDYAVLRNEAEVNEGLAPSFSDEDIRLYATGEDPIFHPNKNWIDETIKDHSFQQNYNVNISGGTEKVRYFTSLGYFNQSGGYYKPEQSFGFPFKHDYDRYNMRMNFDYDVNKDLQVSLKLGNQISNNSVPNGGAWGAFDKATASSPMSSPGFVDGKYISEVRGFPAGVPHYNPWAQPGPTSAGGAFVTDQFANTLTTNLSVKYRLDRITEGLSVRAMGAYDTYYNKEGVRYKYFPTYTALKDPNDPTHAIIYRNSEDGPFHDLSEGIKEGNDINNKWRKIYAEAAIDYSRVFNDVHTVSGLILGNAQKGYYPGLQQQLPAGYLGLVGRVTYDYDSRYMGEFNMGYNGSENFPVGKRFGFFPSFSLGWIPSNESFFPENRWITFMKVRGSYGVVGNDKVGFDRYLYETYPYLLGYGGYQQTVFGTAGLDMARLQMYKEGRLGNPNVTWERSRKGNIGVELKFIEDKLSLTADYFQEKRDNILWKLNTVPETVWITPPPANIGKVDNHGYEIQIGFNDKINTFSYWVKGAYSFARNKIVYQDEPTQPEPWMQKTGQPIGQYFGLTFEGFYNSWDEINDPNRPKSQWEGPGLQPGDMKYKDLDGDNMITVEDMGPIGYSNWPEVTYSFSMGASWNGFDFSVLFQGSANVSVMYASKAAYPFTAGWGPAHEWNLERWSAERYENGEKITYPRIQLDPNPNTDHNYQPSSFWVQDGSFLRLKNAEIGYRFSPGFLSKIGVGSMRIYASGNNLFTWTGIKYQMDPDARELWGRVYPPMRVFNAGVNFQF